ncbi:MAG TPA: endonuclease/exonuclease/phosphatase family protein [Rhizomicrobium sp.]|nr:endonuclease/exonuclease/phosphatase family protein [Rhizomicrobium sp.]
MRVLSWNVERLKAGAKAVAGHIALKHADVVALQEVQINRADELAKHLKSIGYQCFRKTGNPGDIATFVFAKASANCICAETPAGLGEAAKWWREAKTSLFGISAVHIPPARLVHRKEFWDAVLKHAEAKAQERHILIGDFNAAQTEFDYEGGKIADSGNLTKLANLGWIDAWRRLHPDTCEYTWYWREKKGFRVDLAWLSPALAPLLIGAEIDHESRKHSDHAMLIVDLKS